MGLCGSKSSPAGYSKGTEADNYAQRKANGFKDPGLEKVRKDAVKQKKKLRHVDDPDTISKRNLKRNKLKNNTKRKAGGGGGKKAGKKGGGGGGGLTQDTLKNQRANLKKVKRRS